MIAKHYQIASLTVEAWGGNFFDPIVPDFPAPLVVANETCPATQS